MSSAPKNSPELAKLLSKTPLAHDEAKWTKLEKITYQDPSGNPRLWECAGRTTRPEGSKVDAVAVIAIIKPPAGSEKTPPRIVLQKQFRPPTGGVCIEIPAGLVDPNESVETTALRELKEETGYVGKVAAKSPVIYNDPGFCGNCLNMVTVEIDPSDERNISPKAELEEEEFIETFTVPLNDLCGTLDRLGKDGYRIDSRVQAIADGIRIAQQLRL